MIEIHPNRLHLEVWGDKTLLICSRYIFKYIYIYFLNGYIICQVFNPRHLIISMSQSLSEFYCSTFIRPVIVLASTPTLLSVKPLDLVSLWVLNLRAYGYEIWFGKSKMQWPWLEVLANRGDCGGAYNGDHKDMHSRKSSMPKWQTNS